MYLSLNDDWTRMDATLLFSRYVGTWLCYESGKMAALEKQTYHILQNLVGNLLSSFLVRLNGLDWRSVSSCLYQTLFLCQAFSLMFFQILCYFFLLKIVSYYYCETNQHITHLLLPLRQRHYPFPLEWYYVSPEQLQLNFGSLCIAYLCHRK